MGGLGPWPDSNRGQKKDVGMVGRYGRGLDQFAAHQMSKVGRDSNNQGGHIRGVDQRTNPGMGDQLSGLDL